MRFPNNKKEDCYLDLIINHKLTRSIQCMFEKNKQITNNKIALKAVCDPCNIVVIVIIKTKPGLLQKKKTHYKLDLNQIDYSSQEDFLSDGMINVAEAGNRSVFPYNAHLSKRYEAISQHTLHLRMSHTQIASPGSM